MLASMWIARPILLRLVGALLLAIAVAAGPAVSAVHAGEMAAAATVATQDADTHPRDGSSASGNEMVLDVGCPTGAGCQIAPALPDGQAPPSQLPARSTMIVPGDLGLDGLSAKPGTEPPKHRIL